MATALPGTAVARGLRIALHVTPKAAKDEIAGIAPAGRGPALRVKVRAAADRGRANDAMIALLAERLGIARARISLERGATSRNKTVLIAGDGNDLLARFAAWCGTLDH